MIKIKNVNCQLTKFLIDVETNPTNISHILNDFDKVLGKNLTSMTHEPPVPENSGNISYIGKVML